MGENASRPDFPANSWTGERLWPFQGRFLANLTARITSSLVGPRSTSLIESASRNSTVSHLMRLDSTGGENAIDTDEKVDHLLDAMSSPPPPDDRRQPLRSRSFNPTPATSPGGAVGEKFDTFARLYATTSPGFSFAGKGTFSAAWGSAHMGLSNQTGSSACPRLLPDSPSDKGAVQDSKITTLALSKRDIELAALHNNMSNNSPGRLPKRNGQPTQLKKGDPQLQCSFHKTHECSGDSTATSSRECKDFPSCLNEEYKTSSHLCKATCWEATSSRQECKIVCRIPASCQKEPKVHCEEPTLFHNCQVANGEATSSRQEFKTVDLEPTSCQQEHEANCEEATFLQSFQATDRETNTRPECRANGEVASTLERRASDSHPFLPSPPTNPCISFILGVAGQSSDTDSDSNFDDGDWETGGGDGDAIWDSFATSDDPYNPLLGWQCPGGGLHPENPAPPSCQEETLPEDPSSRFLQHNDSVLIFTRQWEEGAGQNHREEQEQRDLSPLALTTCENKSIAFILGDDPSDESGSDSGDSGNSENWSDPEEEEEDSDLLWQSFMRTSDPYCPLNGWKCGGHQVKRSPPPKMAASPCKQRSSRFSRHRDSICLYPGLEMPQYSHEAEDSADNDLCTQGDLYPQEYSDSAPTKTTQIRAFKQVRFADGETLSTVHTMVTWDYAYRAARKGPWVDYARDRCHFQRRINQTKQLIAPYLDSQHRQSIYRKLYAC